MPVDRPTPVELIEAVREYIESKVAPGLEGQAAFHARVAINALGMVARSIESGPAMDATERQRLAALLGHDGDLLEQNRELARKIAAGELDDRRELLLEHLRVTVRDKLALANPRYLTKGTGSTG